MRIRPFASLLAEYSPCRADPAGLMAIVCVLAAPAVWAQDQMVDPDFKPVVSAPAYDADKGPVVAIDKGHHNFHTADGKYAPFAALLRADGYRVRSIDTRFNAKTLRPLKVLVIANALGDPDEAPAFTPAETKAVEKWVKGGGSLLLISDHAPFGSAAESLAARFGVRLGKGYAFVVLPKLPRAQSNIKFTGDMLGTHPILAGRNPDEIVRTVRTFTGESVGVPNGATILLKLPENALEVVDEETLNKFDEGKDVPTTKAGPAQGIALPYGKGRVVVIGEAAMFSAQLIRQPGQPDYRFGMSVGFDDQKFALNTLHWLSGLLP